MAWGQTFNLLECKAGDSVLEYGPGSGQILLMLARLGVLAHGVDIDQTALDGIRLQAERLGLVVNVERAVFGDGFDGQLFDAVIFFEAFHHSLEFPALLERLRHRLKPRGCLVPCGEPVVAEPTPEIPYPWGPRLDALSVYCMRKWGWMELGFTRPFITEAARRAGWKTEHHSFSGCGRASAFVLRPMETVQSAASIAPTGPRGQLHGSASALIEQQQRELEALRRSTSWRVTKPLHALGRMTRRTRRLTPGL